MNKAGYIFLTLILACVFTIVGLLFNIQNLKSELDGEKLKITEYQIQQKNILNEIESIRINRELEDSLRTLKINKANTENLEKIRNATDAELQSIVRGLLPKW